MEEPPPKPRYERLLHIASSLILLPAVLFALYTAMIPCNTFDIGASASHLREVAPKRLPWFLAGVVSVVIAGLAYAYLSKPEGPLSSESKTGSGGAWGCLGMLFLLLLFFLLSYATTP